MEIQKMYDSIIPPSDYHHREGFTNYSIIDDLHDDEKQLIENMLLNELKNKSEDILIVETLHYLKSSKALPLYYDCLNSTNNLVSKISIAEIIYKTNKDENMIRIATELFEKIKNKKNSSSKYDLIYVFYALANFNNEKINDMIKEYVNHKDLLLSYNAKEALRIKTN